MLRSMTGYAKHSFEYEGVSYLVEILSVNRKNLEISLFLPKDLLQLDVEIRKILMQIAQRGHLTLKLTKEGGDFFSEDLMPQNKVLQKLKNFWEEQAKLLEIPKNSITLDFLADQYEKLPKTQKKDLEGFWAVLKSSIHKAGKEFVQSKTHEGEALSVFFKDRVFLIAQYLEEIRNELSHIPKNHQDKLLSLFKDFDLSSSEMQEKIARELVLYLDRADINEELERLSTHIKTFTSLIDESTEAVGKHLDFLIQEFHREANTINSKSQSIAITNLGLKIKTEIEKIREQLQNIE